MSEFAQETIQHETPKVIKNLKKEFAFEKTIAIQELKVALMKSVKELYPSELLDVVEEFLEGLAMDEAVLKFEHFRIVADSDTLMGAKLEAAPEPARQAEEPETQALAL